MLPFGPRVEGELGYSRYSIDTTNVSTGDPAFQALNLSRLTARSGGYSDRFTGTANLFHDLPIPGSIRPYLGGGFGHYHSYSPNTLLSDPNTRVVIQARGATRDNVLLLGEVGVRFDIPTTRWSIAPAYRSGISSPPASRASTRTCSRWRSATTSDANGSRGLPSDGEDQR